MNNKIKRYEPQSIITGKKQNADFYVTPSYVIEALLNREKFIGTIFEPCCGSGSIIKTLKNLTNNKIIGCDINGNKYGYNQANFLDRTKSMANIVTNPPYNQVLSIIQHSLNLYNKKMAFLIRLAFVETQKRYNLIFKNNLPYKIYVFSKRIDFRPTSITGIGGGLITAWLVWHKNYQKTTYLEWIND